MLFWFLSFVKCFAKLSEVFAKFFKVFASFLRFSRAFRGFRIHSDPLGCIRMHSEAIGSVWTFSNFFEFFWIFESFFNVSGRNFYKRLFSRHNILSFYHRFFFRCFPFSILITGLRRLYVAPPVSSDVGRSSAAPVSSAGVRPGVQPDVRPDVRAARVSSAAPKKKSFDRGGPVWPPRSNVMNDRLRGGLEGLCSPSAKNRVRLAEAWSD